MQTPIRTHLAPALAHIRQKWNESPQIGVILGSGLGAWAETLTDAISIPYAEIPGFPQVSVVGHSGKLYLGRLKTPHGAVRVACLQGRVHLYEGHEAAMAVMPARLLALLGCHTVLLTNAAGGVQAGMQPGDLMLIRDHLNLTGRNPLVGPNDSSLGPRFPDMTAAYAPDVAEAARAAARNLQQPLREGVYAALLGPTYETPAEIRMLRTLGADAVGMSTALEVIALRHMGVHCGALSCITNLAAGLGHAHLDHAEVEAVANQAKSRFMALITAWIGEITRQQGAPPQRDA